MKRYRLIAALGFVLVGAMPGVYFEDLTINLDRAVDFLSPTPLPEPGGPRLSPCRADLQHVDIHLVARATGPYSVELSWTGPPATYRIRGAVFDSVAVTAAPTLATTDQPSPLPVADAVLPGGAASGNSGDTTGYYLHARPKHPVAPSAKYSYEVEATLPNGRLACGEATATTFSAPPAVPQRPPIESVLSAVLRPGAELRFARIGPLGDVYEVLPAPSVILRFQNEYPGDPELIRVVLNWTGGTSGPLSWVRSDNVARKQALNTTGYYEVVSDAFVYYVIVSPPVAQRQGTGFNIVIRNRAAKPPAGGPAESQPLIVKIRPVVARTDPSEVFFDCGDDHDSIDGKWHPNCKNSSSIVARHVVLEGWLTDPHPNCLNGLCWEDWHYDFVPNADFIEQIYGRGGAYPTLGSSPILSAGAMLRANPPDEPQSWIGVNDVSASDGSSRGITLNSFIIPGNVLDAGGYWKARVVAELNAWHPEKQGGLFGRHWAARGPAPAGWKTVLIPSTEPGQALAWNNARWPFDPRKPDGKIGDLAPTNYVRMEGTLWQDVPHGTGRPGDPDNVWSDFRQALGAWLEIHPVDWMVRVPPPKVPKTPAFFQVINWDKDVEDKTDTAQIRPDERLYPDQRRPAGYALKCREFIDGRYTDMRTVVSHSAAVVSDHVDVNVTVRRKYDPPGNTTDPYPGVTPGRFKATYVVWWDPVGPADTTCR